MLGPSKASLTTWRAQLTLMQLGHSPGWPFSAKKKSVRQAAVKYVEEPARQELRGYPGRGTGLSLAGRGERASDAIAKLKLTDLVPRLIDQLERSDSRAPRLEKVQGKTVTAVRSWCASIITAIVCSVTPRPTPLPTWSRAKLRSPPRFSCPISHSQRSITRPGKPTTLSCALT